MCQFKSAILLKDRVYVPDHDSHSDMLKELGIEDNYLTATKTFVRVEIFPADGNKASDPMAWEMEVDQDITPDWYQPEADETRVKEAVKKWWEAHVFTSGEHEAHGEGIYYACGSAVVNAYDDVIVDACGSAVVNAYNATMVDADDSVVVNAYGDTAVNARGEVVVRVYGGKEVAACKNATVIIPKNCQTMGIVDLAGRAICINHEDGTIWSNYKWTQEENT